MKKISGLFLSLIISLLFITACNNEYENNINIDNNIKFENIEVGSCIEFGNYEQDNNLENGKEKIDWLVVDIDDNKALLTTKYCLDSKPYNEEEKSCTWENCDLREWLNNVFLLTAFSNEEQKIIDISTLSNPDNKWYDTYGGNDTEDKVFLFCIQEISQYRINVIVQATEYAISKGAYVPVSDTCGTMWRLRSPGHTQSRSACIRYDGTVDGWSYPVNNIMSIRPVIWIKYR
jgi:hypothetical protein